MAVTLFLLTVSFLLGSIPCGFLTAYFVRGIDIRRFGSGNIGATNVLRVIGKPWGILVFILDFLKGFSALLLVIFLRPQAPNYIYILSAILVVSGHNWTPFLKFKGGKGVATSLGAISALGFIFKPLGLVILLALCVWTAAFFIWRYVSLASIVAGAVFFILCLIFPLPGEMRVFAFLVFVFILVRHRSNIKKLISRKEARF
jgi:glycerol-3-phosphate acyltransferase PlsY